MSKLVSFNTQALLRLEHVNTKSLDDFSRPRSEMATASEICGCHRKVCLQLTLPALPSAKELRQKRRGHIFEIDQAERFRVMGFKEVLPAEFPKATGPCFTRQLVVEHPDQPIGSHLDFVIKHKDNSIQIIECKTTNGIPVEPYGNWVDQLHIQLGLIAVRFSGHEIRGSIIASDLSAGEEEEFNSFSPDMTLLDYYVEKGKELIKAKAGRITPATLPGILCGFCSYRSGCPAHRDQEIPLEVTERVAEYECLDRRKKDLEKTLDPIKKELIAFFGKRFQGVTEDGIAVTTTTIAAGENVDASMLKADFPDVYKNCSRPKAGYTKLEVRKLPVQPLAKAA
ncbi:MAG: hypothetical protein HXX11_17110 [Desulfuromonadales bacterium]|nr:hypothetical protein [Desulfuromonadales bacterium]